MKFYALIQRPPLAFADGRHAVLDVEVRFPGDELLDGVGADRAVQVSVKLLVTEKTLTLACSCLLHTMASTFSSFSLHNNPLVKISFSVCFPLMFTFSDSPL